MARLMTIERSGWHSKEVFHFLLKCFLRPLYVQKLTKSCIMCLSERSNVKMRLSSANNTVYSGRRGVHAAEELLKRVEANLVSTKESH